MIKQPSRHTASIVRHGLVLRQANGFTLVEVIAAFTLLALLTAIFGMGLVAAMKSHEFSRINVQIAQKAHLAMNRMSRELMELVDVEAISEGIDDPFIIYHRDVSGSIQRLGIHLDQIDNKIRLYTDLDTNITELNHNQIDQGDVLIDQVDEFELDYFRGQSNWTKNNDLEELSTIRLILKLTRPDSPEPNKTQDFSTIVHMRNTNNYGGATLTTHPVTKSDYSCFISAISNGGE